MKLLLIFSLLLSFNLYAKDKKSKTKSKTEKVEEAEEEEEVGFFPNAKHRIYIEPELGAGFALVESDFHATGTSLAGVIIDNKQEPG